MRRLLRILRLRRRTVLHWQLTWSKGLWVEWLRL